MSHSDDQPEAAKRTPTFPRGCKLRAVHGERRPEANAQQPASGGKDEDGRKIERRGEEAGTVSVEEAGTGERQASALASLFFGWQILPVKIVIHDGGVPTHALFPRVCRPTPETAGRIRSPLHRQPGRRARVASNVAARVNLLRPAREVVFFEIGPELDAEFGLGRYLLERDAPALPRRAQHRPKGCLFQPHARGRSKFPSKGNAANTRGVWKVCQQNCAAGCRGNYRLVSGPSAPYNCAGLRPPSRTSRRPSAAW